MFKSILDWIIYTFPATNIARENRPGPKRKVFHTTTFGCYVNFIPQIPGKSHKSLGKLKKESHEPEFHGGTRLSFATCGAWEIQIRAVTWVLYRATTQVCRVYILDERSWKRFNKLDSWKWEEKEAVTYTEKDVHSEERLHIL